MDRLSLMDRHPDANGDWWYWATIQNTGTILDGLEVPLVSVKAGMDVASNRWWRYEHRVREVTGQLEQP